MRRHVHVPNVACGQYACGARFLPLSLPLKREGPNRYRLYKETERGDRGRDTPLALVYIYSPLVLATFNEMMVKPRECCEIHI